MDEASDFYRRLFFRLEQLALDAEEDGKSISLKSREQFLWFISQHPEIDFPIITLTPEGDLRARWVEDPGNTIVFEFTGGSTIRAILGISGEVVVGELALSEMKAWMSGTGV